MTSGIHNIVYPAADLATAKALFTTLLGIDPYADTPYYVGYRPDSGPEIGLDPNGDPGQGPICYWDVPDINLAIDALMAAGATPERPPTDVGGGLQVATLRDPAANMLGLVQRPV